MGNNNNSKPKVLIVGTFHMAGSDDMHSEKMDSFLSEKRQEEICEVIERLKEFGPTKVALECEVKYDGVENEKYKAYVKGTHKLILNEKQQLGFRIAKDLGHEKLYSIDWMERGVAGKSYGEVYEWAKESQPELFKRVIDYQYEPLDKSKTVLGMYQQVNALEHIEESHKHHLNLAQIGHMEDYVGIDWLIWWYQRNLILFSNICRIAISGDDRILLIIGSAHVYILKQFLKDSGMVELVDVNEFLVSK